MARDKTVTTILNLIGWYTQDAINRRCKRAYASGRMRRGDWLYRCSWMRYCDRHLPPQPPITETITIQITESK